MVLQRIQTLYLLLAAILLAVFAFVPSVVISNGGQADYVIGVLNSGVAPNTKPDLIMLAMDLLVLVLIVVTIFSYKDLMKQLRLCAISIALILALLLCVVVLTLTLGRLGTVTMTLWNLLPFVAFVACILAHRGISHDRKLLSDSQRIR